MSNENTANSLKDIERMKTEKNKEKLTLSTLRKKTRKVGAPKEEKKEVAETGGSPLLSRLRQSEEVNKLAEEDNQKKQLLGKIEQIYRDKIKGGNQLILDILPRFVNILTEIHNQEKLGLYSGDTSIEFKEERMTRMVDRNRSQAELDTKIKHKLQWINMDINSSFENKLKMIQGIEPQDIEVVTRVKYYNDRVEYETKEGVYGFSVEEAQKFGGYVVQQVRILTQELKLHQIMKGMASTNKEVANKNKNLFWLLIEPFVAFTEEGKVLVMDTNHLMESMADNFKKRVINSDFDASEVDVYQDFRKELFLEDHKIVEYIDKNLEIPKTNMSVTFPYHLLEKSGVEFELKYKVDDKHGLLNAVIPQDIVEFSTLEKQILRKNSLDIYFYYRRTSMSISKLYEKVLLATYKPVKVASPKKPKSKKDGYEDEEEDVSIEMQIQSQLIKDMDNKNENHVKKMSKEDIRKKNLKEDLEREKEEEEIEALQREELDNISDGELKSVNYVEVDRQLAELIERVAEFDPSRVTEVSLMLDKYIGTDIDLASMLDMVQSSVNGIVNNLKSTQDHLTQLNIIAEENRREINESIIENIEGYVNYIKEYYDYVGNIKNYFKEINSKYYKVNSILYRHIPTSLSNLESRIMSEGGYPINLSPMIIDRLLLSPEIYAEVDMASKYARPVVNNPRRMMYNYVREMVKFFRKKDIVVFNWLELLKLMVPENVSYLSRIRMCNELRELTQCETLVPLMKLSDKGERNKVRNVNDEVTWGDVRDRTTVDLPPLTESENKFNVMLGEIFQYHTGYLCSIDFENLINYVVNLDEIGDIQGKELVKHIPLPHVIDKYFQIYSMGLSYPKLSKSLFTELKTVPPVIVALQHVLNTGRDYLDSYKSTENFKELESMAIEYGIQKRKIYNRSTKADEVSVTESNAIRVKELNEDYKRLNDIILKRYNKDFGIVKLNLYDYKGFRDYRTQLEDWGETIERINPALNKEIMKLKAELDRVLKSHEKSVRKQIEGNVGRLEEQVESSLDIIEKNKEKITSQRIDYLDNTLKLYESYYDYEKSYNELIQTMATLKLNFIPSLGVLVNLIKTMADDLPKPLDGALLQLTNDFVKELKTIVDSNPFKTPESKAMVTVQVFNVITEALGINSPLMPMKEDIETVERKFEEEQADLIERNKPDMTEEEKAILTEFLNSLNMMEDSDIPVIVRGYHNRNLIPNTMYEELAYPNNEYYGKGYEDFYSEDFSLTENLKMRLETGHTVKPEHLQDSKLMEIVNSVEIDEKFLNSLRDK